MDRIKEGLRGTVLHTFLRNCRGWMGNKAARYDMQTDRVMKTVLRPDDCGVDIGAHRGEVLKHMIRAAPRGRHYAFEPIPVHAAFLKITYPSVAVHEMALGNATGDVNFTLVTNATAYSGLRPRLYDRPDPEITSITVKLGTLDDLISPEVSVALIKIDVEGGELDVLKGGIQVIRRCRPTIVFEAGERSTGQYGVTPAAFFSFISDELNYSLNTMDRWLRRQPSFTSREFQDAWTTESDYYFLAEPAGIHR